MTKRTSKDETRQEAVERLEDMERKIIEARERAGILRLVQDWAGSSSSALLWYRSAAIPSLGGLTAEKLVEQGRGEDVKAYLAQLSDGGYA